MADAINGRQLWSVAKIAAENGVSFRAVESAAARAGTSPALSINGVRYFDDAGRASIEAALPIRAALAARSG